MADEKTCSHMNSCEMYSLLKLSGSLKIWQSRYCNSSGHTECARFKLSLTGKPVPINLMPNGATLQVPTRAAGKP